MAQLAERLGLDLPDALTVTAKRLPTSSSVCSPSSPMPNRRRRISFSFGDSVASARSTCVVRS